MFFGRTDIPSIQTRQVPTAFNPRSRALLPLTSHGMYTGITLEQVEGKEGRERCQDVTVFKLSPLTLNTVVRYAEQQ